MCIRDSTNTMTIWVTVPPGPLNCSLLHANFTPTVFAGGSIVSAINNSTPVGTPYIAQAKWYWGDGTNSLGWYSPSHIYSATGTYTIKLVVDWTDSLGT